MRFEESLKFGQAGESDIARWLRRRGCTVLPVYEKIMDTGKGPQLFTSNVNLIAPDMLTYNGSKIAWVEAKHKTAFTWHRITHRWTTGVDLRHYKDYLVVSEESPWPVWMLFLHRGGIAKDTPPNKQESPSGLFGNEIGVLRDQESHRSENWGRTGMVYWALVEDGGPLIKLASLDDVLDRGRVE